MHAPDTYDIVFLARRGMVDMTGGGGVRCQSVSQSSRLFGLGLIHPLFQFSPVVAPTVGLLGS